MLIPSVMAILLATTLPLQGNQLLPQAKISPAQARAVALKAMPGGVITGQELEKERGGSGLRYSFDVTTNRRHWEIGVDAKTGKILEKSVDNDR